MSAVRIRTSEIYPAAFLLRFDLQDRSGDGLPSVIEITAGKHESL
jgi:hypothetical protein